MACVRDLVPPHSLNLAGTLKFVASPVKQLACVISRVVLPYGK